MRPLIDILSKVITYTSTFTESNKPRVSLTTTTRDVVPANTFNTVNVDYTTATSILFYCI